jgi:sugar O-acyltransferase (sialic acid O-acetyltransferase NeuD family)
VHGATAGLVVVGAGGHAKTVIATAQAAGLVIAEVLDDDTAKWGSRLSGVPVRGPVDLPRPGRPALLAIGDNRTRRALAERLALTWTTAVHPAATVHPSVRLGPGTVVLAGSVIQPDTTVGCHAIVNTAATIDHDCRLGDYVHLAPGVHLSGGVTLGDGVLCGIASAVAPGICVRAGEP